MLGALPSTDRIAGLAIFPFMGLDNTSSEQGWGITKVELREFSFSIICLFFGGEISTTVFFSHILNFDCEFQCHIKLINAGFILAH